MTGAQHAVYRAKDGLWANACAAQGWDVADETRRRAITLAAARKVNPTSTCDSTAHLNEAQITQLFKDLIALARPLDLAAQRASANPEETAEVDACKRLVYAINALGFHRNYVQAIAKWYCRTHQVNAWEDLPARVLRNLVKTVEKNARKKRPPSPAGPSTDYQMRPRKQYEAKVAPLVTSSANPF
jgi:hypothetical protein